MRGMRRRRSSELAYRGKKTLTRARNNTTSFVLSYCGEKKKKIALFLKRFAGLSCNPGTRVTLKEFGGELSVTPTLDPGPGTNRRKLSYESLGYLYMQSKGYATIESWLKKTSISYPDYYNDLKPLKVQYFIFS